MQSAQVVTLKSGQQNASSVDSKSPMHSFELRTSSTLLRFAPESRAIRKLSFFQSGLVPLNPFSPLTLASLAIEKLTDYPRLPEIHRSSWDSRITCAIACPAVCVIERWARTAPSFPANSAALP